MKSLLDCAKLRDAAANACINARVKGSAAANYVLSQAGYAEQVKRTEKFKESYSKYTKDFTDRATTLMGHASQCLSSCKQ